VPTEYFQLANYNIAIGNQPHSEVSALALVLYLLDASCLSKEFNNSKLKIMPDNNFKKIIRK
jgi:tRNA (cytidine56-2'-O)-methyltransferase